MAILLAFIITPLFQFCHRQNTQVLEDIAEDNELTVEKVRSIAKENGISLSC